MDGAMRRGTWKTGDASEAMDAKKEKNGPLIKVKKRLKSDETNCLKRDTKQKIRKFNGGRFESYKHIGTKRLTSGRLKPRKLQEGLFLKGLRTRYVKRDSVNEAEEARRKEDINRIIDLGKVINSPNRKRYKRTDTIVETESFSFSSYEKEEGKKEIEDSRFEKLMTLDKCDLSPIMFQENSSSTESEVEITTEKNEAKFSRNLDGQSNTSNSDLEKEFLEFASKLEQISDSDILLRLPKVGVFEEAAESLRNLYLSSERRKENEDSENEERNMDKNLDGDECSSKRSKKNWFCNQFVNEAQTSGMKIFENRQNCAQTSSDHFEEAKKFEASSPVPQPSIVSPVDFNLSKFKPSEFPVYFTSGSDFLKEANANKKKEPEFSILKELSFDTPPIQFYRRNMF